MNFPEGKKPNDCDKDCECKDCEVRCVNDDEKILVSVSPCRFGLPPAKEKRAKMEIKNKNPYPIYFRASTSNMDAFRPEPNSGRIAPNSKVPVDVQFYDSARPIRRHEEVIVFTSVRPFDQYALYEEHICPYCMEPFNFSKHHSHKKHMHSEHDFAAQEHRRYMKNDKQKKYTAKDYIERKTSEDGNFSKCTTPTQKLNEYNYKQIEPKSLIPREKKGGKNIEEKVFDDGYSKQKTEHQTRVYVQKQFPTPDSRKTFSGEKEDNNIDQCDGRAKHMDRHHGLKEVCIHALVHPSSATGCECDNCLQFGIVKGSRKKLERHLVSEGEKSVRRIRSEEHIPEQRIYRIEKDIYAVRGRKDANDDRKGKSREAHILARILRAEDNKETSDTEISELSSRDLKLLAKQTKIISEENYMKKKEKLKKKLQKRHKEESESTTTTDSASIQDPQKESEEKMTMMERRSTLTAIDEKCTNLQKLSWTTLCLLLFLIFIVAGSLIYCCRSDRTHRADATPCIIDFLADFI